MLCQWTTVENMQYSPTSPGTVDTVGITLASLAGTQFLRKNESGAFCWGKP